MSNGTEEARLKGTVRDAVAKRLVDLAIAFMGWLLALVFVALVSFLTSGSLVELMGGVSRKALVESHGIRTSDQRLGERLEALELLRRQPFDVLRFDFGVGTAIMGRHRLTDRSDVVFCALSRVNDNGATAQCIVELDASSRQWYGDPGSMPQNANCSAVCPVPRAAR